jgi:hypothetical protein
VTGVDRVMIITTLIITSIEETAERSGACSSPGDSPSDSLVCHSRQTGTPGRSARRRRSRV